MKISLSKDQHGYVINNGNKTKAYPRVTYIIGQKRNVGLEAWRERVGEEEANRVSAVTAEYGDRVHEVTMYHDKGNMKKVQKLLKTRPEIIPNYAAWCGWTDEYVQYWLLVEQVCWSDEMGVACRIDRVGVLVGDKTATVVDIKTGNLSEDTGIQIYGAYLPIYNEWRMKQKVRLPKVTRAIAVQLPRERPGDIHVKDYSKDVYREKFDELWHDYRKLTE